MTGGRRLLALLVLIAAAVPAAAQSTFYEAYDQGLKHEEEQRWEEARASFLIAARLRPEAEKRVKAYGLEFFTPYDPYVHLALAELHLGLLDEAEKHLERSAAAGVSPAGQIAELRQELARRRTVPEPSPTAAPAIPTPTARPAAAPTTVPQSVLELDSQPQGADVFLDGRLVATTPVELPLEPGEYRLELRLAGHQTVRETLHVAPGIRRPLSISLQPEATAVSVVATPQRVPFLATLPAAEPTPSPTIATEPVVAAVPESAAVEPTPQVEPEATQIDAPSDPPPPGQPPFGLIIVVALVVAAATGAGIVLRRRRPPLSEESTPTVATPPRLDRTVALRDTVPLPKTVDPKFGGYRLLAVLGRGGMATTYLAERKRDRAVMAIKIPHEHVLDVEEYVTRFIREGAFGATIHHPNIVRIHEAGRHKGTPFIAMEYLDGVTLEQKLARQGALPVPEALEIARNIALALDYAHMKGVVHRDLKPENVMILEDGSVKVMDYGIARLIDAPGLTATNMYLGTPLYSSPEAITPEEVDQQSDLYSLGIILYRMLCNRLPFESSSPLQLIEMHRSEPLPEFADELAIPKPVVQLVKRLAAKKKAERYASAEALLQELNRILQAL